MLIRKAYKFKLRFHDESEALPFYRFAGSCRFIWNRALAIQKERLDAEKHVLPYEELTGKLVLWKCWEKATSYVSRPALNLISVSTSGT